MFDSLMYTLIHQCVSYIASTLFKLKNHIIDQNYSELNGGQHWRITFLPKNFGLKVI